MKTLILINDAYGPSIGGIENSIRHLSEVAMLSKWEVFVVAGEVNGNNTPATPCTGGPDSRVILRYLARPIALLGILNLPFAFILQTRLLGRLRSIRPDAVVVSRFHLSVLSARLAGFSRVRYLVPGIMVDQYIAGLSKVELARQPGLLAKRWLHSLIQKHAIRLSEVYVFSVLMQLRCADIQPNNLGEITVTRPGVDESRFFIGSFAHRIELREKLGLPVNKKLVLFAGRFVAAKGVDLLIEALNFLPSEVELVLVGEGVSEPKYRQLTEAAGLQGRVHLRSPTYVVEEYFRCCDVFAMSSVYEPFGQTNLEALASGLPVIAFSLSAGVQTATEELGFDDYIAYANEYSAVSFARGIERQLLMPMEQRRRQSQKAKVDFNWLSLLKELVA